MEKPLHAFLRCFDGCPGEYPLDEIRYRCPRCGGLLEVEHDLQALGQIDAATWRRLFDSRSNLRAEPAWGASGVWSKREWVLPHIDDASIVTLREGFTPLLQSPRLGAEFGVSDLWLKLSSHSHTGSFKDLGMTVLVSQVVFMRARGQQIAAIACASTGDTSAALAAYCAAAGIPAIVLLPEAKISDEQLIQPLANGAVTLSLQTDFDGCMKLVQELTEASKIYLANSMNPLRIEGQKTVALEICQQLGWEVPDWVVVPGGNLGNIAAIARGFFMAHHLGLIKRTPKLVCAQAAQANPLYESYQRGFREFTPQVARSTAASAIQIGNPVSAKKAIRALRQTDGVVEQASEEELAEAAARADRAGHFVCPQTGVALAAVRKLVARGVIAPDARVIVVATAHGLKFSGFKRRFHTSAANALANPPISVPASLDGILATLQPILAK